MKLHNPQASAFYPKENALAGVTDLCVAAHQDDVEIMAFAPIASCYGNSNRRFCAVILTDGAGSPRGGEYAGYTDEEMRVLRAAEQKRAAELGDYQGVIQLGYASGEVKDSENQHPVEDLVRLFTELRPTRLYTHNLADKHDTHVATALRVVAAVRRLPQELRPREFLGLEVWRGLDWMCDGDKICLDTSANPKLQKELLQVHRSQVAGGKRYDLATLGRRTANATFFASHETDAVTSMNFAMNLLPLAEGNETPADFVRGYLNRFEAEVTERLKRLEGR